MTSHGKNYGLFLLFGKNYGLFYGKFYVRFYNENLRAFLQRKFYVHFFYSVNFTDFFLQKLTDFFYKEKLQAFLTKNYGLFYTFW